MDRNTYTINAVKFKTHCLEMMDTVKKEHIEYIITKKGIPIAKLVPINPAFIPPFGLMKNTVEFMGDIISPIDVS